MTTAAEEAIGATVPLLQFSGGARVKTEPMLQREAQRTGAISPPSPPPARFIVAVIRNERNKKTYLIVIKFNYFTGAIRIIPR